ncbi:MAG: alpha/beta fold hydrolase [Chloroflexota bacterium]|nr:alpha/beta fold hydrolase [Chloroflexota bacterium]MDE2894122.1 alpha/beta fold hydrolase [Chloroflexota bacterium]
MTTSSTTPATVVLIHGAWHGPWCFDKVVAGLEARGVPVVTVDRRRMHDASGELRGVTDSDENEAIVRAAFEQVEGPIVALGHSFGGVSLTTAPLGNDSVKHLVYLTAIMPDTEGTIPDNFVNPELITAVVPGEDGSTTVQEDKIRYAFYHQCSDEDYERALGLLVRDEGAVPFDAARDTAWSKITTTYVVCTEDQALLAEGQRTLARRADRVVEWATDHSPFFSAPHLLVDLLDSLAREYAA